MSERAPSSSRTRRPPTGSYEHATGLTPASSALSERDYEPRLSGARTIAERITPERLLDLRADEKLALVQSRITNTFHPASEEERVSMLDLSIAVNDLWHYLHDHPVSLAKKAELISALEPLRRKLRSDPRYVSAIEKVRARENELRPHYIAAKALFTASRAQKDSVSWDRARIIEAEAIARMTDEVRRHLLAPRLADPSLAERQMDEEIRSIATKIGITSEQYVGNFAFEQGHAAYYALRGAIDRRDENPSQTMTKAVIDAQDTFREALFQEMQEFETAAMRKERAGLMRLREALRLDSIEGVPQVLTVAKRFTAQELNFVQEVYRDILAADTAEDGETAWANIMPRFRQLHLTEQTHILRLARYYREVIHPREQLLMQRHVAQQELETTADGAQQTQILDYMRGLEEELHRETLILSEEDPNVDEFTHEVEHLLATWERRIEFPAIPQTISDLDASWKILTSQYDRALLLFEQLGRLSTTIDRELSLALRQKLKTAIAHMRDLERHYSMCLCRDVITQERMLDTNIWYLENLPSHTDKDTDSPKSIGHKLESVKKTLEQITMTYPPLTRGKDWKTAWENYEQLNRRFSLLGFGHSTVPTVRPPRPELAQNLEDVVDRGRE